MTPGAPEPLGATWDGAGINVAVPALAERVEVCLFDAGGKETRATLPATTDGVVHGYLPGVGPGTAYGFRVHGPWDPSSGRLANPAKLLLDPWARRVAGSVVAHPALLAHQPDDPTLRDDLDSAPFVPRSIVIDPAFDWSGDRPPRTAAADTVLYETHVRGITVRHPDVPERIRGTYLGLAHESVLRHLVDLGVTAVELLPVQHFVPELRLLRSGGTNYWGYNTIAFFAPHAPYSVDDPVAEFKTMVRSLHDAGLEIILDVVYNHTAEGGTDGPTLCFRGLDDATWYRRRTTLDYADFTGTGNTLDLSRPPVLRLVLESLRYWVEEMHVDGFRLDLATTLARGADGSFDPDAPFLRAVSRDPVLRQVKLIAEPWDVGPEGYRLGGFPRRFSEWNDRFRDDVRDFWRGAPGILGAFATRLTGSSDLFATHRPPQASVNLITAHDGFTLGDLVSYDERHNAVNGEGNRDGQADNHSWNSGVEGPSSDPAVEMLRRRRSRSLLATLLLSQGMPLLLGGDELGRTQKGNNNAYNQDNEVSWYDWARADEDMMAFTRRLLDLRTNHPTFRRSSWLHDHPGPGIDHVGWFDPEGAEMTPATWEHPRVAALSLYLDGRILHTPAGPASDDDFLLLCNGSPGTVEFVVPPEVATGWLFELASEADLPAGGSVGERVTVASFGLTVLRRSRS